MDNTLLLDKSFLLSSNSMVNLSFNKLFIEAFDKDKKNDFHIIKLFFISVYIYYQNKNSPLMKYIQPNTINNTNKLAIIPFEFNLSQACIEEKFTPIIFAPLRIEPRITKIILNYNNMEKLGLYELSKVLIFNKNIKIIDYKFTLLHSNYLPFINYGFGIFDNYSVEELNLSHNFLNDICRENLAKLISHFKGLKTINLSFNDFKKGLSSFFIILRKLYSKRKTKLENLYIKKCLLDETSFYELNELLKCKYCKLKILSINNNIIPFNINFFKKLKKNKSLIKLYLNNNNISDNKIYDISKIISNTNIEHLYLHKNDIYNFNNYLRIIYRTKLLKDKNGKNIVNNEESFLTNLDMSKNNNILINSKHIKLLINIIKETTLNSLDISQILYGTEPNKFKINKKNLEYRTYVEELKKMLINDKNKYIKIIKQIKYNKDNNKRYVDYENKIFLKI